MYCKYGSVNWQEFFRSPAPTPPQIFKHKDGCTWLTELPTGVGTWGCSCGLDKLLLELEDYELTAPTPPLDVEAVAEKFFKILTVEVCCECGEPRFPQKQKAGDETKDGWPACVNEECFAYGEQGPISAYRCPISEQQREEILSLLRRHIASPAPQPPICEGCGAGLMLDRGTFYDCFACGHNREKQTPAAASPAQPEKRDEWVSVDERFPELGQPVLVFFGRLDPPYSSVWTYSGDNRYFREQPSDTPHEDVTHWQPLPAPPQSGKEGQ